MSKIASISAKRRFDQQTQSLMDEDWPLATSTLVRHAIRQGELPVHRRILFVLRSRASRTGSVAIGLGDLVRAVKRRFPSFDRPRCRDVWDAIFCFQHKRVLRRLSGIEATEDTLRLMILKGTPPMLDVRNVITVHGATVDNPTRSETSDGRPVAHFNVECGEGNFVWVHATGPVAESAHRWVRPGLTVLVHGHLSWLQGEPETPHIEVTTLAFADPEELADLLGVAS